MRTYFYALLILVITLIMHILGLRGLYATLSFYDISLHLIGGFGIGLTAYSLIQSFVPDTPHKRRNIVLLTLMVGIVWELFEIYYNIAGYPLWTFAYYVDTAKDLLNDIIGGTCVAYLYVKRKS